MIVSLLSNILNILEIKRPIWEKKPPIVCNILEIKFFSILLYLRLRAKKSLLFPHPLKLTKYSITLIYCQTPKSKLTCGFSCDILIIGRNSKKRYYFKKRDRNKNLLVYRDHTFLGRKPCSFLILTPT